MHRLRNHRSFGSVAGTEVAVALASIVLDQSHQHAAQTRSELAAGCSHVPVFNSGSKFVRRHGLTKSMSNSQSGSIDN